MDLENNTENDRLKLVKPLETSKRAQSSQRMKYSAEITLIKEKWGDLEGIRQRLGLSQRKISQLLMVDPSAWTRWTKHGDEAPPHIYRSLSWFLTLHEKHPEAHPYFWLAGVSQPKMSDLELTDIKNKLSWELRRDVSRSVQLELRNKILIRVLALQGISLLLILFAGLYLMYLK